MEPDYTVLLIRWIYYLHHILGYFDELEFFFIFLVLIVLANPNIA